MSDPPHPDYTAAANALVVDIHAFIQETVPGMFQGFIPVDIVSKAAGRFAKTAVDAVDAYRAKAAKEHP